MIFNIRAYFTSTLILGILSSIIFIIRSFYLYTDSEYIYDYLKCDSQSDSVIIPITESILSGIVFIIIHIIAFILFSHFARKQIDGYLVRIKSFFSKNDKISSIIIRLFFYSLALYIAFFDIKFFIDFKFQILGLVELIFDVGIIILYGINISSLIGEKE